MPAGFYIINMYTARTGILYFANHAAYMGFLNIPLQAQWSINDIELGMEIIEFRIRKRFCKSISNLFLSRDVSDLQFLSKYLISDIMHIKFNMFGPRMENRITSKISCTLVITPKN